MVFTATLLNMKCTVNTPKVNFETIVYLARPLGRQYQNKLKQRCKQNSSRRRLLNDYRFEFDVSFG